MKKLLYISFILITLSACSSLVDGLNDDPNNPISASYQYVLTGAEVGNIILQTGETARRAGIFAGYYTGIDRQHLGFSEYTLTTSDFDDLWDDAFVNALRNAIVTEQSAISEGLDGVIVGITQVLQAQALGTTTSLYGAIPVEDAGILDVENPQFVGQLEAYGKIQAMLDKAIGNLQLGTGRPVSGSDIYFDGDPTKWIEAAHTLKARYYMHTKEYDKAYAEAQLGISSATNTMNAPHGTGTEEANLNYQFFAVNVRGADLVTSDFMASLIAPTALVSPDFTNYRGNAKTNETARYNFLFEKTSIGIQPNTKTNKFAANNAPAPLVSYQENLLILAESGFRSDGFNTGLAHLNDFRAFMNSGGYLTGISPADIQYDAYVASDFQNGGIENGDNVSTDNALLREILEERYITFFSQIEGFNDTRRTEKETLVRVPVTPNNGSALPQRFIYPQSEIDRNSNTPNPIPGLFESTDVNN